MLTPPGITPGASDVLANDRRQHLLDDAAARRERPRRSPRRLRRLVSAITSIIA